MIDFVEIWYYLLAITFGLIMGSFLNVLILRIHANEAWWKGRSRCPKCNKELTVKELIPVISFIVQKGRCRSCGEKISYQYILVEIASGLLAFITVWIFGFSSFSFVLFLTLWLLLGNFVSDLLFMELPEIFNIGLFILGVIYQYFWGNLDFISIMSGIAFGFIFFGLQFLLTKGKGIGEGDIRLGVIIGLFLGWPYVIYSIFSSYILATIILLPFLILRKISMKSAVPLGVFLIPVLVFALLFPQEFHSATIDANIMYITKVLGF